MQICNTYINEYKSSIPQVTQTLVMNINLYRTAGEQQLSTCNRPMLPTDLQSVCILQRSLKIRNVKRLKPKKRKSFGLVVSFERCERWTWALPLQEYIADAENNVYCNCDLNASECLIMNNRVVEWCPKARVLWSSSAASMARTPGDTTCRWHAVNAGTT